VTDFYQTLAHYMLHWPETIEDSMVNQGLISEGDELVSESQMKAIRKALAEILPTIIEEPS